VNSQGVQSVHLKVPSSSLSLLPTQKNVSFIARAGVFVVVSELVVPAVVFSNELSSGLSDADADELILVPMKELTAWVAIEARCPPSFRQKSSAAVQFFLCLLKR